jgi:hypothetical protein
MASLRSITSMPSVSPPRRQASTGIDKVSHSSPTAASCPACHRRHYSQEHIRHFRRHQPQTIFLLRQTQHADHALRNQNSHRNNQHRRLPHLKHRSYNDRQKDLALKRKRHPPQMGFLSPLARSDKQQSRTTLGLAARQAPQTHRDPDRCETQWPNNCAHCGRSVDFPRCQPHE